MSGASWSKLTLELGERIEAEARAGRLAGLHAVGASHAGHLVLERYFEGQDEQIGARPAWVRFDARTQHDVRSVTKSIVGILYGIALAHGMVPAVDASLLDSFPAYRDLAQDPGRRRLTIEHALTMTMGLGWDEGRPYSDPLNSEIAMERSADRYRYVLDRPVIGAPGTSWTYSGGAVALVGAIIERGSGRSLARFAQDVLFEPLGIRRFTWWSGADGVHSAAAGLRLTLPDLLAIGRCLCEGGRADGRQIIPADWLDVSFRPHTTVPDGDGYGYLWRIRDVSTRGGARVRCVAAMGNGGQRLWLAPELGLACVTLAGDYDRSGQGSVPDRVWSEDVLGIVMDLDQDDHLGVIAPR